MNVQSGTGITYATSSATIQMPKIYIVEAGRAISIPDLKTGTLRVIGIYANGANAEGMNAADSAALVTGSGSNAVFTAPAAGASVMRRSPFCGTISTGWTLTAVPISWRILR